LKAGCGCDFCEELEKGFTNLGGERVLRQPLLESENFTVIPTIGQIVEGYLLIVSKDHYLSFGAVPEEQYEELERVKDQVRAVLAENYCTPLFFEHGAVSDARKGGCCIDHAHLHAVPVKADILPYLIEHFRAVPIESVRDLKRQHEKGQHYLFLEQQSGKKYIFDIPEVIPSQFLRKVIAHEIDEPDKWDWKEYWGLDEMVRTLRKLRGKFKQDVIHHPQ
jgi:diadenosine tetraphosphate (Ap4A) HIT family hydrolase